MLISSNLIRSAVLSAMRQTPQGKAPRWTDHDLGEIERLLPFHSTDKVGEILGRSGNAVKIVRQRKGIRAGSKSKGWMTANQTRILLGMTDGRPVIGWIKKGLVLGHRINGNNTWLVHEISLRRWIASPVSWAYFDPTAIVDERLSSLVKRAQSRWNDAWLSTRQVADMKGTDTKTVVMAIRRGQLPGIHVQNKDGRHAGATWAFWVVKRSDAVRWDPKAPAFNPTDELHAFMLLARAIGLGNDRIGVLCGLSGETVKKRLRAIDTGNRIAHLIERHERLRCVSTGVPILRVHVDWRKHADQFPHVRRAFDRYMAGKASIDDCYLITRILKTQMVAYGMKCDIGASGRCSEKTVTHLIRQMSRMGIQPYLPR
jgi:hypothetical protein